MRPRASSHNLCVAELCTTTQIGLKYFSPRGPAQPVQASRTLCSCCSKAEVCNAHTITERRGGSAGRGFVGKQQIFRLEIPVAVGWAESEI